MVLVLAGSSWQPRIPVRRFRARGPLARLGDARPTVRPHVGLARLGDWRLQGRSTVVFESFIA